MKEDVDLGPRTLVLTGSELHGLFCAIHSRMGVPSVEWEALDEVEKVAWIRLAGAVQLREDTE